MNLPCFQSRGVLSFSSVTLAIRVTNNPFLDQILQRNGGLKTLFGLGLLNSSARVFALILSNILWNSVYEDVSFPILVWPIETRQKCGRRSNLNFVYYLCESFFLFLACQKYTIVLLETKNFQKQTLYLKHHRTENDGWTSDLFCDRCFYIQAGATK